MEISIIYDTNPSEMIYNQVHLLLRKLNINSNLKIKEFFISKDLPMRSNFSYYSFFYDEQVYSDYYNSLNKILESLNKSNIIIFVPSPHSRNNNRELKNLLNHLSYRWMPHKKNHNMENTIAIMLTSSSCFSFKLKNLFFCKNFRFWGINKKSVFLKNFYYNSSDTININKFKQFNYDISSLAQKILDQYERTYSTVKLNNNNFKNLNKKKALIFSISALAFKKI